MVIVYDVVVVFLGVGVSFVDFDAVASVVGVLIVIFVVGAASSFVAGVAVTCCIYMLLL